MALIEGNDVELLGRRRFLPGLTKFAKKVGKVALKTQPAYWAAKGIKRLHGAEMTWQDALSMQGGAEPTWEDVAQMQGAFLPGLTKVFKKIGKVTAPITTKLAKTFLPASVVDAAAKLDPTKKGAITPKAVAAVQTLVTAKEKGAAVPAVIPSPTQVKIEALTKTLLNPMVLGIAGAGVLVIILLRKRR
jgi:hypothetical protein